MAAGSWGFTSNGAVHTSAAWVGASGHLHAVVQPPVRTTAPLTQAGVAVNSATSTELAAADADRCCIEFGNPADVRLWLRFGADDAAVDSGIFVPPGSTAFYFTTLRVAAILESGEGVHVGVVEWED